MSRSRRFHLALMVLTLLLQIAIPAAYAEPVNIIYVKHNAAGSNNGTSWANAFTSLDAALESATAGKEIWIAEGTYRPTSSHGISASDARWYHFRLKSGVAVYGGFAGTETTRAARNWLTHPVILSGDIGVPGNDSDNCYHVFYHSGLPLDNTAVLDGVTITGGRATAAGNVDGAGMYNLSSTPTLTNVVFLDNKATQNGGGMFNFGSGGIALRNVTFRRNYAGQAGGGMWTTNSSPLMVNLSFLGNYGGEGGGMYSAAGGPTLVNAVFSGNRGLSGGAAYLAGYDLGTLAHPKLINSTFVKNYAQNGGGLYLVNTNPAITGCILWDNDAALVGDQINALTNSVPVVTYTDSQETLAGTGNINANPMFVRNAAWGDSDWATDNDDYGDLRLKAGSPCINAGSNAPFAAGGAAAAVTTDMDGNARIVATTVDMGAYEHASGATPPGPQPNNGSGSAFFSPNTLNIKSRGGWVKIHVILPAGHDPRTIDKASVAIVVRNQTIAAKSLTLYGGGAKGIPGIKADFSRSAIITALAGTTGSVEVTFKWTSGSTTYTLPAVLKAISPGNQGGNSPK